MIELIHELGIAGSMLENALDRYLNACTAIQAYYAKTTTLIGIPQTFASRVASELTASSSYETKIRRANSIIGQARNMSTTTLVPIHTLPSEILARVFLLVVGVSCNVDIEGSKSASVPRFPDFLSHVCSHWRQVAINLPQIWKHIDLAYHHSSDQRFVDRAKIFTSRAGQLPLDVHIRVPKLRESGSRINLHDFLSCIASRIESLELTIPSTTLRFEDEFFVFLCGTCKPGDLLQLTISDNGRYTPSVIYATDSENVGFDFERLRLHMSEDRFEELLLPVRVLRLEGIYLSWSSQAYHGLVELRLCQSGNSRHSITTSQLYAVFASSPKLAVLHFGLDICDVHRDQDHHDFRPCSLEDLREVDVGALHRQDQLVLLLHALGPGTKPLQLTMSLSSCGLSFSNTHDVIIGFLRRSNVARICIVGLRCALPVEKLSHLLPWAKVLVLVGLYYVPEVGSASQTIHCGQIAPLCLDTLYLQGSIIDLDYLASLIKTHLIRAVVLWRTGIYRDEMEVEGSQARAELLEFCPIVRCLGWDDANPTQGWSGRF